MSTNEANMLSLKLFILLLLFPAEPFPAQCRDNVTFQQIRKQYELMEPDDPAAMPFINLLITLTKEERNSAQLTHAYLDALKYHPSTDVKLKYADSAVAIALCSARSDVIADAYMNRGMIHYARYRNYRTAMADYLKAVDYAKISRDPYVQYRLLHHFGIVKGYIGLHRDAIHNLNMCAEFFRKELAKELPHDQRNMLRKSYYETLYELVNIYQQTGKYDEADRFTEAILKEIGDNRSFSWIRNYFLKSKGISEYRRGAYKESSEFFDRILPELIRTKDFATVSLIYYYQGKNALKQHHKKEAVHYFKKVDSIFQRHHFILPELQHGYHYLIYEAGERLHRDDMMAYTNTLRMAEYAHQEDRHHLYTSMQIALKNDEKQVADDRYSMAVAALLTLSVGFGAFTLSTFAQRKSAQPSASRRGEEKETGDEPQSNKEKPDPQVILTPEIRERIRTNLQKFENEKGFLKQDLKLAKVAQEVGVNANYLSMYLNTEKGMRFDRYLSEQRIYFMAALLAEDPQMVEKGAEELAAHCGMKSASNFRHLFYLIYGMSLHEYRDQCKKNTADGNI